MIEPIEGANAYQQALADFGITELQHRLQTFSDPNFHAAWTPLNTQELESLTVILIRAITANLRGRLIVRCLNLIRQGNKNELVGLLKLWCPPSSIELPADFPDAEPPRFLYGDKLCWLPINGDTDWGTVIGRFYSFAVHRCAWTWCYIIWLDKDSPSAAWTSADVAWEEDLKPLEEKS